MKWVERLGRLRCPPGWRLTRALSDGLDPRVEHHINRCRRCAAEYEDLRVLALQVPAAFPVPEKMARGMREAIGVRLRAAALALRPRHRRRRSAWLAIPFAGGAALAALAVVLAIRGTEHPPVSSAGVRTAPATPGESRASIRAIGQARFARVQPQPDEIVRVDDGEIELEIAPLHANERFRVLTENGEVEVRGTSFKVSVSNHGLAAVHVWRGRVEVRSRDGAFAVLDAGDDWVRAGAKNGMSAASAGSAGATAAEMPGSRSSRLPASGRGPVRALATPPASSPALKHHAKVASAPRASRSGVLGAAAPAPRDERPSRDGVSFGHAWSLLRGGDARGAAVEFGEVERLSHGRDIEEDALYWRAVAVGRAGDPSGARKLLGEFLDRFPASSRAGEAASALGWLLLDAGDRRGARHAFERAVLDPSPRLQANGREGLRRTQEEDR